MVFSNGASNFFTYLIYILAFCYCKKTKVYKTVAYMHIPLHQKCFSLIMKVKKDQEPHEATHYSELFATYCPYFHPNAGLIN